VALEKAFILTFYCIISDSDLLKISLRHIYELIFEYAELDRLDFIFANNICSKVISINFKNVKFWLLTRPIALRVLLKLNFGDTLRLTSLFLFSFRCWFEAFLARGGS